MTETVERRAVPHIQHTPELEAAAVAVGHATSSGGTPIMLCQNPLDVRQVREALQYVGKWFEDPAFFFPDDAAGELTAATNLVLLATLLREHLRAGNT